MNRNEENILELILSVLLVFIAEDKCISTNLTLGYQLSAKYAEITSKHLLELSSLLPYNFKCAVRDLGTHHFHISQIFLLNIKNEQ